MPEILDHAWAWLQPPYVYWISIPAILVLLVLWYFQYKYTHRPIVPFKSSGGRVEIAPQTLKGVIQYATLGVAGVEKAASRHFPKRNRIGIQVAVHLHATAKLKEVEAQIKDRIRHNLLDQFGMESVDPIHIRVTRIVGEPISSLRTPKPEATEPDFEKLPDLPSEERFSDKPTDDQKF